MHYLVKTDDGYDVNYEYSTLKGQKTKIKTFETLEEAAEWVSYLNGGSRPSPTPSPTPSPLVMAENLAEVDPANVVEYLLYLQKMLFNMGTMEFVSHIWPDEVWASKKEIEATLSCLKGNLSKYYKAADIPRRTAMLNYAIRNSGPK